MNVGLSSLLKAVMKPGRKSDAVMHLISRGKASKAVKWLTNGRSIGNLWGALGGASLGGLAGYTQLDDKNKGINDILKYVGGGALLGGTGGFAGSKGLGKIKDTLSSIVRGGASRYRDIRAERIINRVINKAKASGKHVGENYWPRGFTRNGKIPDYDERELLIGLTSGDIGAQSTYNALRRIEDTGSPWKTPIERTRRDVFRNGKREISGTYNKNYADLGVNKKDYGLWPTSHEYQSALKGFTDKENLFNNHVLAEERIKKITDDFDAFRRGYLASGTPTPEETRSLIGVGEYLHNKGNRKRVSPDALAAWRAMITNTDNNAGLNFAKYIANTHAADRSVYEDIIKAMNNI